MLLRVFHPLYRAQQLEVRISPVFARTQVFLNGERLKRSGFPRGYTALGDDGAPHSMRLRHGLDLFPWVSIEGDAISLLPPLHPFEYAWVVLPLLLIVGGGLLGGLLGGAAAVVNGRILRTPKSAWARYFQASGVLAGSVIGYLVLAVILQVLIRSLRTH